MNFKHILITGLIISTSVVSSNPIKEPIKKPSLEDYKKTLTQLKATEFWYNEHNGRPSRTTNYRATPSEANVILAATGANSFLEIDESSIENNSTLQEAFELFYEYKQSAQAYSQDCPSKESAKHSECSELYNKMERAREEIKLGYFQIMMAKKNNPDQPYNLSI